MKNYFLLFIFFLFCKTAFTQKKNNKDIFTTTIRYHYGVVMPHHKSISYLINDQISAVELNMGYIPSNEKNWAKLYKQPEVGLGLYHGSLGNNKVLGNVTAIFPYINFPLSRGNKWEVNTQLGIGLGYTKKHFDPVKNYTNLAIGTKFNAFFKLMANGAYAFHSNWNVNAGVGFNHLSNGSFSSPNKGLNLLTGSLGLTYFWNGRREKNPDIVSGLKDLENEFLVVWSHGIKQSSEIDHHKYYATSLSGSYSIGINAKRRFGFGIDLFYDEAANRGKWDFEPETDFENRFSQAIFISHDLVIEKFSIIANIGVYTYYKTEPEKPIYTRLGIRYILNKHLITSLSLKAHMGKADYIEWGIGYRIKKDKSEK
ncbi:acyloxyacyl hydrolase [Labilibaculum euxinus]